MVDAKMIRRLLYRAPLKGLSDILCRQVRIPGRVPLFGFVTVVRAFGQHFKVGWVVVCRAAIYVVDMLTDLRVRAAEKRSA